MQQKLYWACSRPHFVWTGYFRSTHHSLLKQKMLIIYCQSQLLAVNRPWRHQFLNAQPNLRYRFSTDANQSRSFTKIFTCNFRKKPCNKIVNSSIHTDRNGISLALCYTEI